MKYYQFDFEEALSENGFYRSDKFYENSDVEIRLLFLASVFAGKNKPFSDVAAHIFRSYNRVLDSCLESLFVGKENYLSQMAYFKQYVFRDYIDMAVLSECFNCFTRFARLEGCQMLERGMIVDKKQVVVLDVFEEWQILTGVWIPFTDEGRKIAENTGIRAAGFRSFRPN